MGDIKVINNGVNFIKLNPSKEGLNAEKKANLISLDIKTSVVENGFFSTTIKIPGENLWQAYEAYVRKNTVASDDPLAEPTKIEISYYDFCNSPEKVIEGLNARAVEKKEPSPIIGHVYEFDYYPSYTMDLNLYSDFKPSSLMTVNPDPDHTYIPGVGGSLGVNWLAGPFTMGAKLGTLWYPENSETKTLTSQTSFADLYLEPNAWIGPLADINYRISTIQPSPKSGIFSTYNMDLDVKVGGRFAFADVYGLGGFNSSRNMLNMYSATGKLGGGVSINWWKDCKTTFDVVAAFQSDIDSSKTPSRLKFHLNPIEGLADSLAKLSGTEVLKDTSLFNMTYSYTLPLADGSTANSYDILSVNWISTKFYPFTLIKDAPLATKTIGLTLGVTTDFYPQSIGFEKMDPKTKFNIGLEWNIPLGAKEFWK